MTRPIKFRAWDRKEKVMLDWDFVMEYEMTTVFDHDDFIPMQFTGLLDKNGKEIYEGDIVKDLDNNLISEIEWERTGFMQRIRLAYEKLGKENYRKHEYEGGITGLADGKGLEIIGDIYQNPELIKND